MPVTASSPSYPEIFQAWVRSTWAPQKFASQKLGAAGDVSPKTAEKWLAGENAAGAEALIELMAECDDLAEIINKLVEARRATRRQNP